MIGRLHPLLVHLPIGILLLAAAFELLSYFKPYRKLRSSVRAMVLFGALASTLSVVTGLSLAADGAYDERLIRLHQTTGIITTVFAWIVFFARDSIMTLFRQKKKRKIVRIFMFIPLVALVALTGHFGGSLTHGEDYLWGAPAEAEVLQLKFQGDPDSAQVYLDIIAPILDSRCYSCHGPTKQKGELRLDRPSLIARGGKHGEVLNLAQPDSSELYRRLVLPIEDEHHMPPGEKPQLASAELALIRGWLEAGAPFEKRMAGLENSAAMKRYFAMLTLASQPPLLPAKEVAPAPEQAIAALKNHGVIVIPVGDSTHYVSASYVNAREVTDDQLSLLLPIRDQLLWLDLARTKIGDAGVKTISKLSALTRLNLQHTQISDAALKDISSMARLKSVNLVGTGISDAGLMALSATGSLERVYCFNTNVTASGVASLLRQRPQLVVDTGNYRLPARITDTLEFKP